MAYKLRGRIIESGNDEFEVQFHAPILTERELDYVMASVHDDQLLRRYVEVTQDAAEVYRDYWASINSIKTLIGMTSPESHIELEYEKESDVEIPFSEYNVPVTEAVKIDCCFLYRNVKF